MLGGRRVGACVGPVATTAPQGATCGMLPAAVNRWDCCWWRGPPGSNMVDVVEVVAVADMAERKVGLAGAAAVAVAAAQVVKTACSLSSGRRRWASLRKKMAWVVHKWRVLASSRRRRVGEEACSPMAEIVGTG